MINTTYIDGLALPMIEAVTVAAVKHWVKVMQQQTVSIDFSRQTAADFHPDKSDAAIDPASELTFDQAGFIDSQLALANSICKQCGYQFSRTLHYLQPPQGVYLEIYPMVNVSETESTLCTRELGREPEFYDVMVRGETLERVYYELEDIPPQHINVVIKAACQRFSCDWSTIDA